MFPITVQFVVVMLAYGLNERMARKDELVDFPQEIFGFAVRARQLKCAGSTLSQRTWTCHARASSVK